ncbi:MAG: hydrogenase maturation protease [Blastocatellia bacterium]|jgi:hydrogenase maturation protease|nr:hydrogenase maturation protease [Blastocatellia bacterium]
MTQPRILIAGIGNIFLGDDAFGSEVARRLQQQKLPDEVRVVDFGIRGFDLAYALLDGKEDLTILVDATPRGEAPGTLYTIEPDLTELDELDAPAMAVEPHGMNPLKVLAMVKSMGGKFKRILLIGCEPGPLESEEEGRMGLSDPVQAAVSRAEELIGTLVARFLSEQNIQTASV